MSARETAHQPLQRVGGEPLRNPHPRGPRKVRVGHALARLLRKLDDALGIRHERLALGSQVQGARQAPEQRLADALLQPAQLHADSGLRPVELASRAGDAAGLVDRDEGGQQFNIKSTDHRYTPILPKRDCCAQLVASAER